MTKNRDHKHAIRAHMAAHGVNYTTAKRALANTGPTQATSHIDTLRAALHTGNQTLINNALRANAPGPDPADLTEALTALSRNEAAIDEHTRDPESPVTADLLRLAVLAEATHGHHISGSRWYPTANDVCRAALSVAPCGCLHPLVAGCDHDTAGDPTDLAAVLAALADDTVALTETADGTGVDPEHLTEALLLLAHDLNQPTAPRTAPLTDNQRAWANRPHHHLIVTAEPLTDHDLATLTAPEIADYYANPADRDYAIECPGIREGGCEGYEECHQCILLTDEQREQLEWTGVAHGLEHHHMHFGWATPTSTCSLQAFPDAWIDSATDLNLPPGRYTIDYDWNDGCDLTLATD